MEIAHPSYAHMHIVLHMSLTHWVKLKPKNCAHILHQCVGSSLWVEPKNNLKTSKNYIHKHNKAHGCIHKFHRGFFFLLKSQLVKFVKYLTLEC
jgi:hypothetical protein